MLKHVTNTTTYMKKYDSVGRVDTISLNSSIGSSSSSDDSITDSGYENTTTCSSPSRSSSSSSIHIIHSPKVSLILTFVPLSLSLIDFLNKSDLQLYQSYIKLC